MANMALDFTLYYLELILRYNYLGFVVPDYSSHSPPELFEKTPEANIFIYL